MEEMVSNAVVVKKRQGELTWDVWNSRCRAPLPAQGTRTYNDRVASGMRRKLPAWTSSACKAWSWPTFPIKPVVAQRCLSICAESDSLTESRCSLPSPRASPRFLHAAWDLWLPGLTHSSYHFLSTYLLRCSVIHHLWFTSDPPSINKYLCSLSFSLAYLWYPAIE